MNIDRLINMLLRMVMRKGLNSAAKKLNSNGNNGQKMTKAERQKMRAARQSSRRAKQAMKLSRRIGRM